MSTDSVPLSRVSVPTAAQRLKAAFMLSLGGLLVSVRTIFLPHALAAGALFVLAVYAAYTCWATWLPAPFSWLAGLAALIGCGALALAYALVTSLVCALRHAAVNVEDFLYELFASLKEKVRGKIDAMDEGVAKQQAKVILENSLREVFAPLMELRFNTAPALVAGVFVSLPPFVSRVVFMALFGPYSGGDGQFFGGVCQPRHIGGCADFKFPLAGYPGFMVAVCAGRGGISV